MQPKYVMHVKITGPNGEVVDSWKDEIDEGGIIASPPTIQTDALRSTAIRIIRRMSEFLQSRGWQQEEARKPDLRVVS